MTDDVTTEVINEVTAPETKADAAKPEQPAGENKEVAADQSEPKEPTEAERVKHSMQKRVDKLTARLSERERALQQAMAELEKAKPAKTDGPPQEGDFESTEEYLKALGRYEERQEREAKDKEAKQAAAKKAHEELITARRADYDAKEAELRTTYPDYDDATAVVADALNEYEPNNPGAKAFANIMLNLENTPAMTYHLGKNPEVLEQLRTAKSEFDLARILFVEEYKLKSAPKTKQSPQPSPPKPLSGSGSATRSEDALSGRELRKKAGLI